MLRPRPGSIASPAAFERRLHRIFAVLELADERAFPRIRCTRAVTYRLVGVGARIQPGVILDIGPGGIRLAIATALRDGMVVSVQLGSATPLARVIHTRRAGPD